MKTCFSIVYLADVSILSSYIHLYLILSNTLSFIMSRSKYPGTISADVILGKKYEKVKRKRGKCKRKWKNGERKRKNGERKRKYRERKRKKKEERGKKMRKGEVKG